MINHLSAGGGCREAACSQAIDIRPAEIADVAALTLLEEGCFRTDRLSARSFRRFILSSTAVCLVAVEADALIGSAVVLFRKGARLARFYSLAVSAGARGKGVGARLLGDVERSAQARGSEGVRLEVALDNPVAIRLYETRGYRRVGVLSGFYEDGTDAARMVKRFSCSSRESGGGNVKRAEVSCRI